MCKMMVENDYARVREFLVQNYEMEFNFTFFVLV